MQYQAPKGTKDITPRESHKWQYIERIAREICESYGFCEVRTPVIEHTELFLRGVGDATDIVQKEMYTFLDKGDRSITLKPEGTAGVARMFIENSLYNDAQPTKMYYLYCPVFRYDKPQAGRLREHHQFGVEVYGAPRATADAECIFLSLELFRRMGITGLSARINSIGCKKCRPQYNDALKRYLIEHAQGLCVTCKNRLKKNPLRILDCKAESCVRIGKGAPKIIDYLCGECEAHFAELQAALDMLGTDYTIDPLIVRGLDYYTKTVFEIVADFEGYKGTVCGGGRYDGLLEELGGPPLCGVGFGLGMERLLLIAELAHARIPEPLRTDVYVASLGEKARLFSLKLVQELRAAGVKADMDHAGRSLKAQFKFADKLNARFVATLGEAELIAGECKLKNMDNGEEITAPLCGAAETIKARIG